MNVQRGDNFTNFRFGWLRAYVGTFQRRHNWIAGRQRNLFSTGRSETGQESFCTFISSCRLRSFVERFFSWWRCEPGFRIIDLLQ